MSGPQARRRALLPVLVLGLLLPGCPKPVVLGPVDFGPHGRLRDPSAALDSILARRDRIKTLRGEARVALESPDGSGKVTENIAACPPGNLRLETISFFGSPIAVLTSDGSGFALNDLEHQKFFQGPATPDNVSRLLPMRLRPEDIVSLLIGVPPLLVATDSVSFDFDELARQYKLVLKTAGAVEVIAMDPATLRPTHVWMNAAAGLTAYEAAFDDYDPAFDLPRSLEVSTREPKAKVQLRWRDREVNTELPVNTFRQQPAPGAERVSVGDVAPAAPSAEATLCPNKAAAPGAVL